MTTERFKAEVGADISEFQREMRTVENTLRTMATGADVEIRAMISDFMTDIARINSEVQKLDATTATVEIAAVKNDFMRDLLQVKAAAQELDGKNIKIDVKMDDKILDDIIKTLYELEALGKEKVNIKVDLDTSLFYTQLAMVNAEIDALRRQTVTIKVDMDLSKVLTDLAELKAQLAVLNGTNVINIDADTMAAIRALAAVRQAQNRIQRNIFVKIWVDYTNAMKAYANTVQAFAEAGRQMLIGAFMALLPAIAQLAAVLVGVIGGLGVMIGVLAGQMLILASAVGIAAVGFIGLAAVAIPTIKTLFDETAKLTAEQQKARAAWDGFKATYDDMVKKTEGAVLQAFIGAMNAATKILQVLEPLVLSVADKTADMMATLSETIDSASIQVIFDTFNKFGPEIFENMVKGIGSLVAGLFSLIAAFTPAAATWSGGFADMMASFAAWAAGLKESEKFQAFIGYVQTYMPMITSIFADLIMGIVGFFTAFGGMGEGFIKGFAEMMASFGAWAEALGSNQQFQTFINFIVASTPAVLALLGNLWNLLINLLTAFAPIGVVVLNVANIFLTWINAALQSNGAFSMLIALLPVIFGVISALVPVIISVASIFGNLFGAVMRVLPSFSSFTSIALQVIAVVAKIERAIQIVISAFAWLISPIGLVVIAIGLVIAAFVLAYQKVEWFRNAVQTAWSYIKDLAAKVFGGIVKDISNAFKEIVSWAKEQLAKFSSLWESSGGSIMQIVAAWCSNVMAGISVLMNALLTIIDVAWSLIIAVFRVAWELIAGAIEIAISLILGIIKTGMQLLQGDWEGAWNTIKQTAVDIFDSIIGILSGLVDALWDLGVNIIQGLIDGIASMFDSVKSALGGLTELIPSFVKKALGIHSPSRVMAAIAQWIPKGIAKGITDNINSVKTATKQMTSAVAPDFSKPIQVSQKQISDAQKVISKTIAQSESDIKKIHNDANKNAKSDAKETAQKILAIQQSLNGDKYKALTEYVTKEKSLQRMSASQEAAFWKYAATAFKDGTDEKIQALAQYQNAYDNVLKDQYANEINTIDKLVKYARYSLTEQLSMYQQYIKQCAVGSAEQIAYEEKIYDTKVAIYDGLKSAADDYLSQMQSINQKLLDDERSLRDAYQQTLDSRIDAIKGAWGLFDSASLSDMSEVNLVENMRSQAVAMAEWVRDLSKLETRGINETLLAELRELGPKSAAEIKALTQLTSSQLDEYQKLWQTKTDLATTQATKELESSRKEMEAQVALLHQNTEKELETLRGVFESKVKELTGQTKDQFNYMAASLPQIGSYAIKGLINGLTSMEGSLKATATRIAKSLKTTLQSALDIHSPSRWAKDFIGVNFVQGIIDGIQSMLGMVDMVGDDLAMSLQSNATMALDGVSYENEQSKYYNSSSELTANINNDPAPVEVIVYQEWDGEQVATFLDKRRGTNHRLNTFKKGR